MTDLQILERQLILAEYNFYSKIRARKIKNFEKVIIKRKWQSAYITGSSNDEDTKLIDTKKLTKSAKAAYNKLILKYHPDKNSKTNSDIFNIIQNLKEQGKSQEILAISKYDNINVAMSYIKLINIKQEDWYRYYYGDQESFIYYMNSICQKH